METALTAIHETTARSPGAGAMLYTLRPATMLQMLSATIRHLLRHAIGVFIPPANE